MGGTIVDGKTLRHCTGTKNTKEFKENFELEEVEELTHDRKTGAVTGKKVYSYIIDKEGKKREIGFKTYRSKSGKSGKTDNTLQYSPEFQKCLKDATAKR